MQQYLLELAPAPTPRLDNFIAGKNAEARAALDDALARKATESVYLWGESAAGKTHLLRGAVTAAADSGFAARYVDCATDPDLTEDMADGWLSADNVASLSELGQIRLFDLYNILRERGGMLLAAGPAAPGRLLLRPDLRSRLGWGLVFQLHRLDDAEKRAALANHARQRGFDLKPEMVEFMLNRWPRDLLSLIKVIDALDRYSMQHKRSVSVDLLREMLRLAPPERPL